MAVNKLRYYLGPLGYLQPLPGLIGGANAPEAPIHIPGGVHTTLSGRAIVDRTGIPKRTWSLAWDNLRETDRLLLDAAILNGTGQPLRLIDPRSSNRLPADTSAGGSLTTSTDDFVSSLQITDTYTRTVSNGWGTADTGQVWTVDSTASDYAVGSGVGTHNHSAAGIARISYLAGVTLADMDVFYTFTLPFSSVLGDVVTEGVLLRGQSVTNFYRVRATISPGGAIDLSIIHGDGTTIATTVVIAGLTFTGQSLTLRGRIVGQTIQGMIWATSGSMPATWQVSGVDNANKTVGPGWPGIRTSTASGNTNTKPFTIAHDNFSVTGVPPLSYLAGSIPSTLAGVLGGGQSWVSVFQGCALAATAERMPLLAGSTYTFTVYATGTAQFKLTARPFDVAGTEQTLAVSSTQTPTGSYQRFTWVWTPSAGQVSAYFGLQAQSAGNLQTTAWQVVIDDQATPVGWGFGVGCPTVTIEPDIGVNYWRDRKHRIRLVLRES